MQVIIVSTQWLLKAIMDISELAAEKELALISDWATEACLVALESVCLLKYSSLEWTTKVQSDALNS